MSIANNRTPTLHSERTRTSFDLHLHTYWSYDASAKPESYFQYAKASGTRCIAITDHHVLDGHEEFLIAAADYPEVNFILSAELTVTTSIGPVDLLCYGFPQRKSTASTELKDMYHTWQRDHGAAISKGMQIIGHDFSDEDRLDLLRSYRPAKVIAVQGNTQMRYGLLKCHFLERRFIVKPEDFGLLLERAEKAFGGFPQYPDVAKVVPLVKETGAIIAIAHPFDYFKKADIMRMDTLREECGLDGIECAHPEIPAEYSSKYRAYCKDHGLFSAGGTDLHTDGTGDRERFACHVAEDDWLDDFLERLG
jgi:predicted metal-dependent phosphoesterase TrpH